MLSRYRRLREHIRYHSAPRSSSVWSRALDWSFIISFLLAFPAALLADLAVRENQTAIDLRGILARSPENAIDAWMMSKPAARPTTPGTGGGTAGGSPTGRTAPEMSDRIIGNFTLTVTDVRRGWPLITTVERQRAGLTIDIVAERTARTNVVRDRSDEHQRAIESALEKDDQPDALAAWNLERSQTRRQWWAWFPAAGAWWIMLFAALAMIIQVLRFSTLLITRSRTRRACSRSAEGKCPQCGYDMTGLEFNEKCPECGGQVW